MDHVCTTRILHGKLRFDSSDTYCMHLSQPDRPDDYRSTQRQAHAIELMRQYKFAATFESSERNGTVSAQFYLALEAGAVPSTLTMSLVKLTLS